MNAFHRISLGPTLPELISLAADERADRSIRKTPLLAWCRAPTVQWIQARGHGTHQFQTRAPSLLPEKRVGAAVRIGALLGAASLVLAIARGLQQGGLLNLGRAAAAICWSGELSAKAMSIWRQGRLRSNH